VDRGVIDLVAERRFDALWDADLGVSATGGQFAPCLLELIDGIRQAYKPFAPAAGSAQPTDTLLTKVVLGTFGCLPACDRHFIDGFRSEGLKYSCLDGAFVERAVGFCQAHLSALQDEQASIKRSSGARYPLMKLVDMYFWQIGYERDVQCPSR
jgi:hypothetical protein